MLKPVLLGTAFCVSASLAQADETATLTSLPSSWTASDGAVIDFSVLRNGKPFGQHVLTFDRDESGELKVTSDVDLEVKIGPFTAFKYRLDSVERWEDGQLISLTASSNNDGRKGTVSAQAEDDALVVESTKFEGELPLSTIPSSHWNRLQVYQSQMLSTETGEVLDIAVEVIGNDQVVVDGETVETTHYRLKSDITVDLWYDSQSRWVKLAFETRGQDITYVLNRLY